MYIFKSCPKCRGDLAVEQHGVTGRLIDKETEFSCLQCGYYLPASQRRDLLVRIAAYLRERRARTVPDTAVAPQAAA